MNLRAALALMPLITNLVGFLALSAVTDKAWNYPVGTVGFVLLIGAILSFLVWISTWTT